MNNEFWKKYFGNVVGLAPIQPPTKPLLKKGTSLIKISK